MVHPVKLNEEVAFSANVLASTLQYYTESKQQSLWCLLWCFWKEMLWPYLEILHFASTQSPLATIGHSKSIKSAFSSKKNKNNPPKILVKFETSLRSFHAVSKLLENLVSLLSSLIIVCFCTCMVRRIIRKQEARGYVNSHNIQICKLVSLRKCS